jgi:hypothetical protein
LLSFYVLFCHAGQLIMAAGYSRVSASVASVLANSEVLFACVADALLLHEQLSLLTLAGVLVIFLGALLAASSKQEVDEDTGHTLPVVAGEKGQHQYAPLGVEVELSSQMCPEDEDRTMNL